jgi:hypothetical protein
MRSLRGPEGQQRRRRPVYRCWHSHRQGAPACAKAATASTDVADAAARNALRRDGLTADVADAALDLALHAPSPPDGGVRVAARQGARKAELVRIATRAREEQRQALLEARQPRRPGRPPPGGARTPSGPAAPGGSRRGGHRPAAGRRRGTRGSGRYCWTAGDG